MDSSSEPAKKRWCDRKNCSNLCEGNEHADASHEDQVWVDNQIDDLTFNTIQKHLGFGGGFLEYMQNHGYGEDDIRRFATGQNSKGNTFLHFAARDRNEKVAQELISHGADVRAKDKDGLIALHFVDSVDVAKLLMKFDADLVNVKDHEGNTPVHFAYITGNCNLVKTFLKTDKVDFSDFKQSCSLVPEDIRKDELVRYMSSDSSLEEMRELDRWMSELLDNQKIN